MKKSFLASAAFAAMLLASCEKGGGDGPTNRSTEEPAVAYMSIGVASQRVTRSSDENEGVATESKLNTLYLITFDEDGNVMEAPGTSALGYTKIDVSDLPTNEARNPAPVKVDSESYQLVVVANPGPKLAAAIETLTSLDTYDDFNAIIAGVTTTEIVSSGFTMMSAGDDTGKNTLDVITDPRVVIGDHIELMEEGETEAQVIADAAANRLTVDVERLAGKLALKAAANIDAPDDAEVALTAWTVDAVNSTFYPFAEKTILAVPHTAGDYLKNFYTEDPNFTGATGAAGLVYTKINNPIDPVFDGLLPYDPILPWATTEAQGGYYGWKAPGADNPAYVIENTMAAASQLIANSTRVVMKATYYPEIDDYINGTDWFSWAGEMYATLGDLQAAYAIPENVNLIAACNAFYTKLDTAFDAEIIANGFATLTEAELALIPNGGEVVKNGTDPVIRWYQGGRCYYSYEVQHDNEQDGYLAFGKYGVVRNNWYELTLASVAGPGTPWYPDPNNPGPGDPDPTDPIDPDNGFLGVQVDIKNWVYWQTPVTEVD